MGYQMVAIRFEDQGRMRSYTVHRLVALAYHGPRPDGLDIAHGNCIKTDNRPSNLRYTTRSDNILDSLRMGQWPQGGGREAIYPWREMEVGESFRANGRVVDGVGLIDATTTTLKKRAIGEIRTRPTGVPGLTDTLTGFENHMGATLLGQDASPLGTVLMGVGNSDSSGTYDMADPSAQLSAEGVVQGNVIATYLHGPVLARNPQLADVLLARATGQDLADLTPLDLPEVAQLRKERLAAKRVERF